MHLSKEFIDGGTPFDWGKTSSDYAKFRDIYPADFYTRVYQRGVGTKGQHVLDLGTGTGVIPRNMVQYGAQWTGVDISEQQIEQAEKLSAGMGIRYVVSPTEQMEFPAASFDAVTACQCFWYFDHEVLCPKLHEMLKPGGKLLVLYMAWLPYEDSLAMASEKLVLKYSPQWSGCGETMHPISIPAVYNDSFRLVYQEEFPISLPFTRESWHGRMKACRGIGASLSEEKVAQWEKEHRQMLLHMAPPSFTVAHYIAMAELQKI